MSAVPYTLVKCLCGWCHFGLTPAQAAEDGGVNRPNTCFRCGRPAALMVPAGDSDCPAGATLQPVVLGDGPLRVYLDDARATPPGFTRVYWPEEAIALLETNRVRGISLDHDLSDDSHGTGYDVVLWIEEAVALRAFNPPTITVHSANTSAREKMEAGIRAIERLAKRNL